jgi:hypothetical protein
MDLTLLLAYVFRYKWVDILRIDNFIICNIEASYEILQIIT